MGKSSEKRLKARKVMDSKGKKTQDPLTLPQVHSSHCTGEQGSGVPKRVIEKPGKGP